MFSLPLSRMIIVIALLSDAAGLDAASAASSSPVVPRGGSSSQSAPGNAGPPTTAPSVYTETFNCPTVPMTVAITPSTVPSGWTAFTQQLNLIKANVDNSTPGKQELWCTYKATAQSDATMLLRRTALPAADSCIVHPSQKAFLCKPGSVN